jgi:outer membrane protein assembly factor BamB
MDSIGSAAQSHLRNSGLKGAIGEEGVNAIPVDEFTPSEKKEPGNLMDPRMFTPGKAVLSQASAQPLGAQKPTFDVASSAAQLLEGPPEDSAYLQWKTKIAGRILAPPAIDGQGGLYAVNDEALVAIEPGGKIRWQVPQEGFNIFASPVVGDDGTVYVAGSGEGFPGLFAFSKDGKLKWKKDIGEVRSTPVIGRDGTVYASTVDGKLYAFGPMRKKWSYDTGKPIDSCPAVGPDGTLYVFNQCGPLHALSPQGKLKWKKYGDNSEYFQSYTGIGFTPEGNLLGCTWNSHLRYMDRDGSTKWLFGGFTEKRVDELPPDQQKEALRAGNVGVSTTPVVSPDGETMYIGGMSGKLIAVDRNGNKKWSRDIGEGMHGSDVRVAEDGTVYAVSDQKGTVFALSPQGDILWKYETKEKRACSFSIRGTTVYLATRSGDIFAIDGQAFSKRALSEPPQEGGKDQSRIIEIADGFVIIGGIKLPQNG